MRDELSELHELPELHELHEARARAEDLCRFESIELLVAGCKLIFGPWFSLADGAKLLWPAAVFPFGLLSWSGLRTLLVSLRVCF